MDIKVELVSRPDMPWNKEIIRKNKLGYVHINGENVALYEIRELEEGVYDYRTLTGTLDIKDIRSEESFIKKIISSYSFKYISSHSSHKEIIESDTEGYCYRLVSFHDVRKGVEYVEVKEIDTSGGHTDFWRLSSDDVLLVDYPSDNIYENYKKIAEAFTKPVIPCSIFKSFYTRTIVPGR